ncbi:hypothetical protein EUTSA_v10010232mg [Eutrema salsugineum]|uniref:Fungal lipase-like domain-containing protein n=1 Tax=Eutrema salsugineum TaxID=72664 RepID=V4NHR8_EUTSA|nr:protein EDS1 [Eutrema salsugineum]ESQ45751.1 hypothetical protein EUTSA_v10010232mg [Eutrema salsugineum]
MAFEAFAGINDLITKSWKASTEAYKTDQFHKEEEREVIFFSFRPSFSEKDWFAPENKSPFGEIKMDRVRFPCMRSIGNDVDATVNQAFLKNLDVLLSTTFCNLVKNAAESRKYQRIVFTGHSSGGATAILATIWYLEEYFKKKNGFPEPLCVTFGAPLVGDYIFKHALGRENWSRFFVNYVTRFDIVPRIMLARKESIKQTLPHVLPQLDLTKDSIQVSVQSNAEFYTTVLKDTSTVAYQAVCELIGNGEAFLETLSSFLELSPYRPAGTFVFSTGTRLVSVNNSDAILQILFYASQSSNEHEWSLVPNQSIRDHRSYVEMVQTMGMRSFHHLDLPLDGDSVLSDLGLSTRARQCVRAAYEAEKKRVENQTKIYNKQAKIEKELTWIEIEYKPKCRTHKNGYYDSFKASMDEIDFNANVKRAELAGIYDEVLGLVKKGQLPDGFEGSKEWVERANRYRRLIEPLDIANYHRHLKNEDTGPYMEKGRPNRYKHAQRGYEHELMKERKTKEEIERSSGGSCFWAEVEELMGKDYEHFQARIKKLEWLLEEWIRVGEVDDEIFLEGSTFRKLWNSLPEDHKRQSKLFGRMG